MAPRKLRNWLGRFFSILSRNHAPEFHHFHLAGGIVGRTKLKAELSLADFG